MRALTRLAAVSIGLGAAGYAASAARNWYKFGKAHRDPSAPDQILDRFLPEYDIVETHCARVAAPADVTFAAARQLNMSGSVVARALFKGRELLFGNSPHDRRLPDRLIEAVQAIGWVVLNEVPRREIVFGAVTRPWEANPVFRSIAPEDFAAFNDPQYVKIAWTLRADPVSPYQSIFRTETRAIATDSVARTKFRRYWSLVQPGVVLIRLAMLRGVRKDAERRAWSEGFEFESEAEAF